MEAIIRRAKIQDAAGICRAIRRSISECCIDDHHGDLSTIDAWLRNKTVPNTEHWLSDSSASCFVAEMEGEVVGFGMAQAVEVLLCYVTPEVRFKGVGKALLQAIEHNAVQSGVAELRLESTRTARAFYSRNGFSVAGPVVAAFGMEGLPMAKTVGTTSSFP